MKKIFFDTEFTQLRKDATLISIGLVSDDGRKFYAEFDDYNKELIDDWTQKNVINNLFVTSYNKNKREGKKSFFPPYLVYGNKEYIRTKLYEWLKGFNEDIQLISDVCHYDMVLFIDIFGTTAFDLPDFINPSCHDINQDIAKHFNISEKEAFNLNRENILNVSQNGKHNSLVDALIIKHLYEKINN